MSGKLSNETLALLANIETQLDIVAPFAERVRKALAPFAEDYRVATIILRRGDGHVVRAMLDAVADVDRLVVVTREQRERLSKLESAARFAYDAILESSVCDEPCSCIDCQMLETLGEALGIPRIGET